MTRQTMRGYLPEDERSFGDNVWKILKKAAEEIAFLVNRGYNMKHASTFVGNHYLLSERQRMALARVISSEEDLEERKRKKITDIVGLDEVYIDGFNTIISLEVALSGSPVFSCMDETIRDLAGLRGTYRIIEKTANAIDLIIKWLEKNQIKRAVFYLDAPVSNSGRLKAYLLLAAAESFVDVEVVVINDVDRVLMKLPHVISADAIILNHCYSWVNMVREIVDESIQNAWVIDLFKTK